MVPGGGRASLPPVASWSRDGRPGSSPRISASPSGCPVTDEKWTSPRSDNKVSGETRSKGTLPTVLPLSECCCVLKLFPRPAHLSDIPESPGEARPPFTPNAAGGRTGRVPSLLEARERDLFRLHSTCCFFPQEVGRGGRTWETVTHHAPLAVFLHLSRQYNNERELGNFEEEIRQNLPGTRPLHDSKDLSPGEAGARL